MQDLVFELNPSRLYFCLVFMITCLSVGVILLLPIFAAFKFVLCAVTLLYGVRLLYCEVRLLGAHAIRRFRNEENEHWFVETNAGAFTAPLLGESVITQFVIILRFKTKQPFYKPAPSCVIFRHSLADDQYRRLRCILNRNI